MHPLKWLYFLTFAVTGAVLPYVTVYFRQEGMGQEQVGLFMAASSLAFVLTPALITLLADTHVDPRHLLAGSFILGGACLIGLEMSNSLWAMLFWWVAHNMVYMPVMPLQDGVNFSLQRERAARGETTVPYHRVRVYGSWGYILPNAVAFGVFYYRPALPVQVTLWVGAGFCACGAICSLLVPRPLRTTTARGALPTMDALRTFFRPPVRVFAMAMFLLTMASMVFYSYFSIYVTETVRMGKLWVGALNILGVLVEIGFVLGFGRMVNRWGLRRMMLVGIAVMAARFAMMAAWPHAGIAVGNQMLHGAMVIVMLLVPPVFVDRHARPEFRNSMQGVYVMLVVGTARIAGNLLAGWIAERSVLWVWWWAAGLCVAAAVLIAVAFYEEEAEKQSKKEPQSSSVDTILTPAEGGT